MPVVIPGNYPVEEGTIIRHREVRLILRPVKIIIDNEDIPTAGHMKTSGATPIRNVYARPMHPFQYLLSHFHENGFAYLRYVSAIPVQDSRFLPTSNPDYRHPD